MSNNIAYFLTIIAEVKPIVIGASTGLLSVVALGEDLNGAIIFGGLSVLGLSLGQLAMTLANVDPTIDKYLGNKYFEPVDFLAGALGTGALLAIAGAGVNREVLVPSLVAGTGSVVGPMIVGKVVNMLVANKAKN